MTSPTDGTLVIDITGRTDPPPRPSIVYFQTPTVLNRAADPLALLLSGDTDTRRVILDQFGNGIAARDLTPGTWYTVLATPANRYEFAEPIPLRPQDFDIVVARVPTATASIADLQAILDAAVQFPTNEVVSPPDVVGANNLWFGVPADAPDIDTVVPVIPLGVTTYSVNFNTVVTTLTIGGVLYKWWFGASWVAGAAMRVIFEEYA